MKIIRWPRLLAGLPKVEWKTLILHPFLFAIYPVLALLAENVQEVPFSDTLRSFFAVLLLAGVLLILNQVLFKNWYVAALISSLIIVLVFSYGHLYSLLKTTTIRGNLIGRHRILVPIWAGTFVLGTWILATRIKDLPRVNYLLNTISGIALILPSIVIATFFGQSLRLPITQPAKDNQELVQLNVDETERLPDIYYIILDSYGRSDILLDLYSHDNGPFLDYLSDQGFYVAEGSTSNYLWTATSLASSLNMDYLPNLNANLKTGNYPSALYELIKQSAVRKQLEGLGYSTVTFSTGWFTTEIYDADYFLSPDMASLDEMRLRGGISAFENMLIHSSAALILADVEQLRATDWIAVRLEQPFMVQREIILAIFNNLQVLHNIPGPKFVFAHILSPHKPYIFGPNGEFPKTQEQFTFAELGTQDDRDEDIPRYRDQLKYVNIRLEEVIDEILANSENQPIIILQADHGPGIGLDWEKPQEVAVKERNAIFNAYYLPSDCNHRLYPTISPVNTFRVVFNCSFDSSIPLLEDESYFNDRGEDNPFDFVPIQDMFP
jgi:hypothetical protein